MLLQSLRRRLKVVLWELKATSAEYTSGMPQGDGLAPTENMSYHWSFVFLGRPHFGATFRKIVGLHYTSVLSPRCIFILEILQLLCTFLYLNSQPMLGILQPILKSLLPAQRECLQQGLLDLPAAYQGHQADISVSCGAFHSSPFFGQRKLNTDEPMEQKEHIKLIYCWVNICSVFAPSFPTTYANLCYTCRLICWLR